MNTIIGIITAIAVMGIIVQFGHDKISEAKEEGNKANIVLMIILMVLVCVVVGMATSYLYKKAPSFSGWLVVPLVVVAIAGLMLLWRKKGDSFSEFLCFFLVTIELGAIAIRSAEKGTSAFLVLVAILVPILAVGFYAFSALKYQRDSNALNDEQRKILLENKKDAEVRYFDHQVVKFNRLMAAVAVVTLFILAGTTGVVLGMIDGGVLLDNPEETTADAADAESVGENEATTSETNWHFYNNDVQGGSEDDDFNFGPEPTVSTATDYDKDFRSRLEDDPALGAADIAWADAWLGTRYLGEFYESCNEDWAKTINAAKEAWIKDPDAYKQTLDAFFDMLNTADVKVTAGNGLEDQMYMNPYTVDGTPDVIVLVTPDHTGKFLTYSFTIKGTGKVKVSYRVECGYQPTNVEEIMGITPQDKPSSPGSPGKSNPPGKGDNPPTPTPPTPKYVKDKTKGVQGDKVKPGEKDPNTNNPSNPNKSKADTNDSTSAPGKTTSDNKANVEEKKEAKERQTGNGGGSKPSTDSGGKTVDNSGGSDSGHTNTSTGGSTAGDKNDGVVSTPS